MEQDAFRTADDTPVTAVTAAEMHAVDRVAVEEFGLELLQMMENAGRNLAENVREVDAGPVTVLAGNGGNGGGGLCAARHLANRDISVSVVLDREPAALDGAAATQYRTVAAMDVPVDHGVDALADRESGVTVDALVGYGLEGALRGTAREMAEALEGASGPVVSLDVPSGTNATTGERPGPAVDPDRVVTLALPKTGLTSCSAELFLADISIPNGVYDALDIPVESPFADSYSVTLSPSG